MLTPVLLALAALVAAPVLPQGVGASACAALPESGPVAMPGPPVIVPARPAADRHLRCPDGLRLDASANMPICIGTGIKVVDGSPRNACYAALPFGPIAPLTPRLKPTRSCPVRSLATIIRIEGANAGVSDAVLTAVPPDGITLTTLTASGNDVKEIENPVLQRCFGFACRLVKLEAGSKAAATVELRLQLPGRDAISQTVKLVEECPH